MDGYSIKEAASVLGIPKRRVWELIARGVLSGAPEGDGGMRVFLQPRATPPSAGRRPADEPRTNGNGGHPEPSFEASPFREVLTEFRMLTERYGQALLALGEARGEVAALRSRVEQLEARVDLRLPGPRPASTVAWEMPDHPPAREPRPEPTSEPGPMEAAEATATPPASEAEVEPDAPAPSPAAADEVQPEPEPEPEPWAEIPVTAPVAPEPPGVEGSLDDVLQAEAAPDVAPAIEPEPTEIEAPPGVSQAPEETVGPADAAPSAEPIEPPARKRRARSSWPAMAAFSEALERAQDPTLAELPGAREAGEAMAALQRQMEDLGLRDEIAVDEVAQVAEVEASDAGAEPAIEPAAAAEPSVEQVAPEEPIFEPIDVAPVPLEALVEEAAEAPRLAPQQPVSVDELEPAAEIEPDQASPPEPEAELGPELAAGVLDAVEPIEDAEPDAAPEPATSAVMSPYSTEVVEPDWFADGDFSWLEAAAAATGEESADERTEEASAPVDAPAAPAPADAPSTERAGDLGEVASEAETQAEAVAEPEVASEAETPAEAVAEETAFEPLEASVQPAVPTQPVAAPAPSVRASARRQDEEELMWLGDEFDAAELELETPGWGSHPAAAPPPRTEPQPLLELSDAELAQLASDEGWDPTEVEAIRTFLGRRSSAADASEERLKATATGAPDDVHPLDEAAPAAFGARAPADPATPPEGPAVLPESGGVQRRAPAIGEADVQGIAYEQDHDPAGQTERDWLRGRRGPAATAYRRLRRLFPG